MATITFRVTEEEKNFLKKVSDFNNKSLSDFVKQQAIETAEDIMDYNSYLEIMKNFDEKETVSFKDAMKELDF